MHGGTDRQASVHLIHLFSQHDTQLKKNNLSADELMPLRNVKTQQTMSRKR